MWITRVLGLRAKDVTALPRSCYIIKFIYHTPLIKTIELFFRGKAYSTLTHKIWTLIANTNTLIFHWQSHGILNTFYKTSDYLPKKRDAFGCEPAFGCRRRAGGGWSDSGQEYFLLKLSRSHISLSDLDPYLKFLF